MMRLLFKLDLTEAKIILWWKVYAIRLLGKDTVQEIMKDKKKSQGQKISELCKLKDCGKITAKQFEELRKNGSGNLCNNIKLIYIINNLPRLFWEKYYKSPDLRQNRRLEFMNRFKEVCE